MTSALTVKGLISKGLDLQNQYLSSVNILKDAFQKPESRGEVSLRNTQDYIPLLDIYHAYKGPEKTYNQEIHLTVPNSEFQKLIQPRTPSLK